MSLVRKEQKTNKKGFQQTYRHKMQNDEKHWWDQEHIRHYKWVQSKECKVVLIFENPWNTAIKTANNKNPHGILKRFSKEETPERK